MNPFGLAKRIDRSVPLGLKIGIPVVAISIVATALLGTLAVTETRGRIDEAYVAQAREFAGVIGDRFLRSDRSLQAMNTFLAEFEATHPELLRVHVHQQTAAGPIVWASSHTEDVGLRADPHVVALADSAVRGESTSVDGTDAFLTVEPAGPLGEDLRSIAFYFSGEARTRALTTARRRVTTVALAVIGVQLAALTIAIYFVVLRRARRLGRAAAAVAAGNLDVRLPEGNEAPGRDELVNAAREFDHMVRAIREAFAREREDAERLRALDLAKSTLLHAVSHDLRGPLTSILGSAMTLQQGHNLSEKDRQELLMGVIAGGRKMQRLVTDLLDLDRLNRGIVTPQRVRTDVGALVRRVAEELGPTGHPLHLDVERVEIAVDAPKVERIVDNLLSNTVRHTPRGTDVWVGVHPAGRGVRISVADAGPGVPDELKPAIFEPFRQGAQSPGEGAGIGLSLVARFAELHGGRAWVEDRAGGGAVFFVEIPDGLESDAANPEADHEGGTARISAERGGRSSIG